MAHFAKVNSENIVTQVIVIKNSEILDDQGLESENLGREFIASLGLDGNWIQTSYNANFRGVFASIGYVYDSINDIFIEPEFETEDENEPGLSST
jgi:hypothetical protein